MKRKVNRVGTGTLTVSLPMKWAEINSVQVGNEVEVTENGNQLILSTTQITKKPRTISFHIDSPLHRGARKFVYYAYKEGFDEVHLTFDDPKTLERVNSEVDNLIGFEIISQRKGSCTVKNVAAPLESTLPDLINKAFLITISMSEDILNAFKNDDNTALEDIELQELTQNKLSLASLRIINDGVKIKRIGPLYTLVSELEGVADYLKYICCYYKTKRVCLDPPIELLFKEFIATLKETYREFLVFDLETSHTLSIRKDYFCRSTGPKIMESCKKEHQALVSFLISAGLSACDVKREIFMMNMVRQESAKGIVDSIKILD